MARLQHVNVAAEDAEALAEVFSRALGLSVTARETVEEQGVRVVELSAGEAAIEITEPTGPDTPVGRFLAKRGGGLHHLAFEVPDLEAALRRLEEAGVALIDERPRTGAGGRRVAFAHPRSFGGVLVELVERGDRITRT